MGSIYGQTLGLVGAGSIGLMAGKKAQVFGLKVIACDPYLKESIAKENGITLVSLPELLRQSDYISIHVPLTNETRHLIGQKEISMMKPSAFIINTSCGEVIDGKALPEKKIYGAGLDVFEKEPIDPNNILLEMDNVTIIPHSASYSDEASKHHPIHVAQEAARILTGHWPKNLVNKSVKPKVKLVKES